MFNNKEFLKSSLKHREEEVEVPELAAWFDKDDKPVWKVRGLSHKELSISEERSAKGKNITDFLGALTNDAEKIKLMKALVGHEEGTPKETARRIEMLAIGSVEPEIDFDTAVKMAQHFPVVFGSLTNTILKLTGLGSDVVGKPMPSGKEKMSKTA